MLCVNQQFSAAGAFYVGMMACMLRYGRQMLLRCSFYLFFFIFCFLIQGVLSISGICFYSVSIVFWAIDICSGVFLDQIELWNPTAVWRVAFGVWRTRAYTTQYLVCSLYLLLLYVCLVLP